MDADSSSSSSSSSSSPPSLRRKLRTTVCGCFGSPLAASSSGSGEKRSGNNGARWRRRVAATGEFGYDPLSYALNFDDDSDDSAEAAFRYRNFNARLPRSPAPTA